ncbi:aminoglycoside phosphotransferase family protein [Bacillus xiapuensis]|uniref:aminoglycoside phosphotransferase family protein n=1 Tax=Bacillus xiapuensis TaxID=2014075 RepID=UPI0012FD93B6|nr:aminoglycoside phosphotransferase family protein [Bacillus xiapuensis]
MEWEWAGRDLMKRMTNNSRVGDALSNRLLFLLSARLHEQVLAVHPLKNGKWLIQTDSNKWFLKRYSSYEQLKKQIMLTEVLLDKGFKRVIPYRLLSPVEDGSHFYAVMPFIPSADQSFSFRTKREREEALALLSAFHQVTASFSKEWQEVVPAMNQLVRWQNRLRWFIRDLPVLSMYFSPQLLRRYAEMGEWCLQTLMKRRLKPRSPVIIHGDVAAHNFFRTDQGKLLLIDFDLAQKAPAMYDYLQWSNRVLPILQWNLPRLMEHKELEIYRTDEEFRIFLMYPTDVYRECRRFILADPKDKGWLFSHVCKIAIRSFKQREEFFLKWT